MLRLALLPLLLALPASAGRRRVEPPPPDPVPVEEPAPPAWTEPLFPPTVVVDPGPVPPGLASDAAQACAACHPRSYEDWRHGGHARAPSPDHVSASAGLVGCDACHRPRTAQRPTVDTVWDGHLETAVRTPNPAFDAGAWLEGVGCAGCHVRGGVVLTADPEAAARQAAPHPLRHAPALATGEVCAACHQLSVPGSEAPLYDTVGELQRSGFAAAGVTCLTCHGRAGAEVGFATHDPGRPLEHALSVGLSLPSLALARGAEPVAATVRLRNTGAGHAIPTGSPWRRVEVRAWLEGPPDAKTKVRPRRAEVAATLGRTLTTAPPYVVTGDTRLDPGEELALPMALALPLDVPAAGWELVVDAGVPGDADRVTRRWPLSVD